MLPRVQISKSHSLSPSPYRAQPPFSDNTPLRFPTLPPGAMDNGVDFRAFYPYTPNEVKHRKRTTSDQLKTLEGIFKRDTKPNAALRNELAARLDMTPRGVQVWFQNRRAKEKSKAGKAAKASSTTDSHSAEPSPSPSDADVGTDSQLPAYLRDLAALDTSPVSPPSPSWPVSDEQGFHAHLGDANLLRRGSLPVDMNSHFDHPSHGPPLAAHLDPFARRLSVDASLLSHYPSRSSSIRPSARHQMARLIASPYPRPDMPHIASAPITGSFHPRHASADARAIHYAPSGTPIHPPYVQSQAHHAVRASLPDNNLYAFSSRMVGSPIPGPLPSPGFSFGAANASSADSERSSPDPIRGFAFQGEDSEDDHTSSYDALSRFGSITSVATSDTSNGSAYYSDCPMDHDIPPNVSRRASCTSNQFLGMMSSLDVNRPPTADVETFSPADNAYSSPSTVSPGSTHSMVADGNLPVSHSSELAFALQNATDQRGSESPFAESSSMAHNGQTSSTSSETYMYSAYPPSVEGHNPPENYHYQETDMQPTSNYYVESYNVDGSFNVPDGVDMSHHYYGSYDTNPQENAAHSGADFTVYS